MCRACLLPDVELPETRQLQPFERGPPSIGFGTRPIKHMKDQFDFRGPELIHNMLQYGQYGVQVCLCYLMASSCLP